MQVLFEGMSLGLLLSLLVGPAFFILIQTSIERGFKAGVAFALGVFLGDLFYVLLVYFGFTEFLLDNGSLKFLEPMGGALLIGFGLAIFFRKGTRRDPSIRIKTKAYTGIGLKGFSLNVVNPPVAIFWIGIFGTLSARYLPHEKPFPLFLAGTLGTVLLLDIIKAYIAHQIQPFLKEKLLHSFNRIVGSLLIVFGLLFLWRMTGV